MRWCADFRVKTVPCGGISYQGRTLATVGGTSQPHNSLLAIRVWHSCVYVYVSNSQTRVVARSHRHRGGVQPSRAVAAAHARARGASADRVRGHSPWRRRPNRCGTPRRLAVAAIGGIRPRPSVWSATACRHDGCYMARPLATRHSHRHRRGTSRGSGQLGRHRVGHNRGFRRGPPADAGGATDRSVDPQVGVSREQRVECRGTWARCRASVRCAPRRSPIA